MKTFKFIGTIILNLWVIIETIRVVRQRFAFNDKFSDLGIYSYCVTNSFLLCLPVIMLIFAFSILSSIDTDYLSWVQFGFVVVLCPMYIRFLHDVSESYVIVGNNITIYQWKKAYSYEITDIREAKMKKYKGQSWLTLEFWKFNHTLKCTESERFGLMTAINQSFYLKHQPFLKYLAKKVPEMYLCEDMIKLKKEIRFTNNRDLFQFK